LIGYGGAAFGGKTDGLLGIAGAIALSYPGSNVAIFRRTFTELGGAGGLIQRSQELWSGIGIYNQSAHRWDWPGGSKTFFCHCQYESDVFSYHGWQIDVVLGDEATEFTWYMIDYILSRNRATVSGLTPFAVLAANPGGVGHAWYKAMFIDPGASEQVREIVNPNGKRSKTWMLRAFADDNVIGMARDPGYKSRLRERETSLAEALLEGNWNVFSGQAFAQWNVEKHTEQLGLLPGTYIRWRAMDYGYVHPADMGWFARDPDNGRVFMYREENASGLTDRQQARRMKELTAPDELIRITYASPDMWARKNVADVVSTAADEFAAEGVVLTKADNDRVNGKRKLDRLLAPLADGKPGLIVDTDCQWFIRVMANLVRSRLNPEDVEKVEGDDPYDMVRYGLTNITPYLTPQQRRTPAEEQYFTRAPISRLGRRGRL
jgi:hypothetical protein